MENICEKDKFVRLARIEIKLKWFIALLSTPRARNVVQNNSFSSSLISCSLKIGAFVLRGLKMFVKFRGDPRINVTKFPSHVWILIFNMDERSRCAEVRKYPSSIDNRLDVSLASNETVLDSSRPPRREIRHFRSLVYSLAQIYPPVTRSRSSSLTLKLTSLAYSISR